MEILNNTYLKFIEFKEFSLRDVKRLFLSNINSEYEIITLKEVIKERSEKINLFDFPNENFGILGVNNKDGIFDAYEELGKNINQSYKKVYLGDLAYNPYRVNVGSVGIKTKEHKFDYISPAYVVFSCDRTKLLPDYFYLVFKSNLFSGLVNENTTGSVRQNLKFSTLAQIKIPVPSLDEQNRIVEEYNKKIQDSINAEKKSQELEKEIETYLMEELGIEIKENKTLNKGLQFVEFKNIQEWNIEKLLENSMISSKKYELVKFENISDKISDGTHQTPTYTTKENGVIFISSKDVTSKEIDWNNVKYIPRSLHNQISKNFNPKIGDIFLAKNGTTGVAAMLTEEKEFAIYVSLAHISPYRDKVNPYFFLDYINSSLAKSQFDKNLVGVGVPNLHLSKIRFAKIPLPPLEIQEKIVKHIGELKEEIRRLKNISKDLKENAKIEFEKEIFS